MHVQRSMDLRGSFLNVVSPAIRPPRRLHDRFLSLSPLLLSFLLLHVPLPRPFMEQAPAHETKTLFRKVTVMAMIPAAVAAPQLPGPKVVAAIQVPSSVIRPLAMAAAMTALHQFLLLPVMLKLTNLPSLQWFILLPHPPLLSVFTRPPKKPHNFGTLFLPSIPRLLRHLPSPPSTASFVGTSLGRRTTLSRQNSITFGFGTSPPRRKLAVMASR